MVQTKNTKKMAKKQKGKMSPGAIVARGPRQTQGMQNRNVLDKAAADWARLLNDPCNAPLTYPCFPGASGGTILMRFESDATMFSGTDTAGIYVWVPGLFSTYVNSTVLTTDTLGSVLAGNTFNVPGRTFITSNTAAARPVAGCVQVMYPGTELNRSGVVGVGLADASNFNNNIATADGGANINTNAASVRTMAQHVERMPSSVVEMKWFPGEADAETYSNAGTVANNTTAVITGRNALFVSASGFPASTGIRIRTVVVYELTLTSGSGTVSSIAPPVSINTPAQVVKALFNKDPQWYLETSMRTARGVGTAISYAAAGYKAVQNVAAAAGFLL